MLAICPKTGAAATIASLGRSYVELVGGPLDGLLLFLNHRK
ncbi:hypothetical protein [Streptomyces sp. NPDC001480]